MQLWQRGVICNGFTLPLLGRRISMPEKKYIKYYRTKQLGKGRYEHVAILNALGRKKFGKDTFVDRIHIKGSKKTIKA